VRAIQGGCDPKKFDAFPDLKRHPRMAAVVQSAPASADPPKSPSIPVDVLPDESDLLEIPYELWELPDPRPIALLVPLPFTSRRGRRARRESQRPLRSQSGSSLGTL
jgi:hypothetical protein